jgi:hypothetical protein
LLEFDHAGEAGRIYPPIKMYWDRGPDIPGSQERALAVVEILNEYYEKHPEDKTPEISERMLCVYAANHPAMSKINAHLNLILTFLESDTKKDQEKMQLWVLQKIGEHAVLCGQGYQESQRGILCLGCNSIVATAEDVERAGGMETIKEERRKELTLD